MSAARHTEDDLQIMESPLEFIRRRPDIFLPAGQLRGDTLATRLASDILCLSKQGVAILQCDQWWVVAGEEDWIRLFGGERRIEECFVHMIPFPEYGVNTVHEEVVVTAFARSVSTAALDRIWTCIVGGKPDDSLFACVDRSLPNWRRLVAFQLP
jgi:hypothetical protein